MTTAISPELALVDPHLRTQLLAALPEAGCFMPAPQLRRPQPVTRAEHARPPTRPAWSRLKGGALAAAILVVTGALASAIIVAKRPAGSSLDDTTRPERPAGRVSEPATRRYAWSTVPGATTYIVTLQRGRETIYRSATHEPTLTIPRALRLTPGRYTWIVQVPGSSRRTPLLESTFLVRERS